MAQKRALIIAIILIAIIKLTVLITMTKKIKVKN